MLQTEVCYELTNKILSNSEIFKASAHNCTRPSDRCRCAHLSQSCRLEPPTFLRSSAGPGHEGEAPAGLPPAADVDVCGARPLSRRRQKCGLLLDPGRGCGPCPMACVRRSLTLIADCNEREPRFGTVCEAMKSAVLHGCTCTDTPLRGSNVYLRVDNAGHIIGSAVLGKDFQMYSMLGVPLQCAGPPNCD